MLRGKEVKSKIYLSGIVENTMFEYIILASVVVAGVCGIIVTKNVFGSNEIHGKLKNRYLEYIDNLEKDLLDFLHLDLSLFSIVTWLSLILHHPNQRELYNYCT